MTVRHENTNKIRRSQGVLPPFSQPQFYLLFYSSSVGLLSHAELNVDRKICLLKSAACVLERQTHRSICHFRRRDETGGGGSKSKNAS